MKKLNEFLNKNITKMILIFTFLSPFFDLSTSLLLNLVKIEFNIIIIFKMLFMAICIYYLFFVSKSKYKSSSIVYILAITLYIFLYTILTIIQKDTSVLSYEIQHAFRNFFFPINLVCIANIYEEKEFNITIKHLSIILLSYIILLFIPTITKTDFSSYAYSKVGSIGWFNSTNEIGAILSILLPFGILSLSKIEKNIIKLVILLISVYTYFSLGTKVPILSLGIVIGTLLLIYIIKIIKLKKIKQIIIISISSIIMIITAIILIPKTSFYKNIQIHLDFLEVKSISDFYDIHIIDHFIFSERVSFYIKTKNNYLNAPIEQKLFGIGYIENYGTDNINIKTIEMDYYDIFFRNGIIGFILYFIPYIIILTKIVKKLGHKNNTITKEKIDLYLSIILILLLSLFSGHIITAPSVSIFCIIILIMTLNEEDNNENSIFSN